MSIAAGQDFSAGIVHGLLVTVTPDGWSVRRRGRLIASGVERGAVGLSLALDAAGGLAR